MHGIRTTVLRLTNTYGPRMRVVDARQTFLGIWIRQLLEGTPISIYGDGKQIRDFNYVDDVVSAMQLAALSEQADGEVFNLGDAHPVNLKDTARLLVTLREQGRYRFIPFPDDRKQIDIGDYYGNFQKITTRLNWKPVTSLREGLTRTVEYYAQHCQQYWPIASAA